MSEPEVEIKMQCSGQWLELLGPFLPEPLPGAVYGSSAFHSKKPQPQVTTTAVSVLSDFPLVILPFISGGTELAKDILGKL